MDANSIAVVVLRGYLLVLSGYHVITGAISYFAPGFAMSFYKGMYGADPIERRHLHIILRPWGALAIFAGVAGLAAARDPYSYEWVIIGLAVLLSLRVGYRIFLRRELLAIGQVKPVRNAISCAVMLAGICIMILGLFTLHVGGAAQ